MTVRPSLFARALKGGALTAGAYAATQVLRLASNLILTRLLFPEAFGLMALVSVVLVGLQMFSDAGIGPSIAQSPRGDDPEFLDTAWTAQVLRGVILWLGTLGLAGPVAALYDAPDLARLLPVAGLTLLIAGFNPTRIDTANRHLLLGRVTALDLVAQTIGIGAMVALALALGTVWALVIGAVAVIRLAPSFPPVAASPVGRWLAQVNLRVVLPYFAWFLLLAVLDIGFQWLATRAFGIPIPWEVLAARIPILYVVLSVPSLGGFGPRELTWAYLFSDYGPRDALIAYAFATNAIFLVLHILIGAVFLPQALSLIARIRAARASGEPLPEHLLHDPADP